MFCFVQRESAVLQQHVAVGAFDGERGLEDLLQPLLQRRLALQQGLPLEESLVGGKLDVDEIGDLHDILEAPAKKNPLDLPGLVQNHSVPLNEPTTGDTGSRWFGHESATPRPRRRTRRIDRPQKYNARVNPHCSPALEAPRFPCVRALLNLNNPASRFELLLDLRGLLLGDVLLEGLVARFHQVLGLLQAQPGDGPDFLDDGDFLRLVEALQNDGELRLLLGRRRLPPRPGPPPWPWVRPR